MRISDCSSDVCSSDLLTTDQVFQYHHEHALTLHEAYEVYGATRLSCAFCVLASKHDIEVSAGVTANHDLYRLLVEIEARTGRSEERRGGKEWRSTCRSRWLSVN